MTRTTLWAGPQDGAEVSLLPDQRVIYVDGPNSKGDPIDLDTIISRAPKNVLRGVYALNVGTGRYEWKGYERDHTT